MERDGKFRFSFEGTKLVIGPKLPIQVAAGRSHRRKGGYLQPVDREIRFFAHGAHGQIDNKIVRASEKDGI